MVLHAEPNDSFDLSGSEFVPAQPFISPPKSIETTSDGMWRTGGASISGEVNGNATLGTLPVKNRGWIRDKKQRHASTRFFLNWSKFIRS